MDFDVIRSASRLVVRWVKEADPSDFHRRSCSVIPLARLGDTMTVAERVLRSWAESKEPVLQKAFIEYAFGKVPDKPETTGLENKPVLTLHYGHELPGWRMAKSSA